MSISQKKIQKLLLTLLAMSDVIYKKNQPIQACVAKGEECIVTQVDGKEETSNVANEGDYIVKNIGSAGEQYIVAADVFPNLYDFSKAVDETWAAYLPKGQVKAIDVDSALLTLLEQQAPFQMDAPWGELQRVELGDKLVTPLPKQNEIYRIAASVFKETYRAG